MTEEEPLEWAEQLVAAERPDETVEAVVLGDDAVVLERGVRRFERVVELVALPEAVAVVRRFRDSRFVSRLRKYRAGYDNRSALLQHSENQARLSKPNPFAGPNGSTAYHEHGKQFIHTLVIHPPARWQTHANQHSRAVAWPVQRFASEARESGRN